MFFMFEWKPQFSVGIKSIDGQHQNLFAIARELYGAMSSGQGKQAVGQILSRLAHYTAIHFAHEERLLQTSNYPGLAKHKLEHQRLTERVQAFQADFEAGRVALSVQLLQFLRDWLEHHIQTEDTAYAPHLKANAAIM
jgi:hemerythrin-like metal-binding protein